VADARLKADQAMGEAAPLLAPTGALAQVLKRGVAPGGDPATFGASVVEGGVNFALAAPGATGVELVLFDPRGAIQAGKVRFEACEDGVFHGFVPGLPVGTAYGYRVHGPWAPQQGHRFDPAKLLLDPWAKVLTGRFRHGPEHFSPAHPRQHGSADNAHMMVKGVVVDPASLSPLPRGPRIPWHRTLIAETHARGFTITHPGLNEAERGTFLGLASDAALDWLKSLGATAVELLPVQAFIHDGFLLDRGLRNYWGYNTLSYFAPHAGYAHADPVGEMRAFVQAAHDRGLEVLLDIAFNHTCEGDHRGPSLSFRGISNTGYYRLDPAHPAHYADITGCGSTLDASKPLVKRLVVDALEHWAGAYGIDGFRFDLASHLGTGPEGGFDPAGHAMKAIQQSPRLRRLKLIAEPWTAAAGGYQVGNFPHGWAEWNDTARDAIKLFWRGDARKAGGFAEALSGSARVYRTRGRPLHSSINYVACHDGFTVADLVRYARKHNLANGEHNRDGNSASHSANYGHEGPSDDPQLEALRERQTRNMLASALLAFGTPMFLAGDEFGRTQQGNNNAYAQDNPLSWHDWELALGPLGQQRTGFFRRLAAVRQTIHSGLPIDFPDGGPSGNPHVSWWSLWGQPLSHVDWEDPELRSFAMLIDPGGWLLVFNASDHDVRFRLPLAAQSFHETDVRWSGVLDTAEPGRPEGTWRLAAGDGLMMMPRSLQVCRRQTTTHHGA
jgi:isoamylase